ncbi:MAG TPA: hypothetical protein VHT93_21390 [Pseudolabrys sp.]|nr:hypothetical protein [Pseudolabrys sp.]
MVADPKTREVYLGN